MGTGVQAHSNTTRTWWISSLHLLHAAALLLTHSLRCKARDGFCSPSSLPDTARSRTQRVFPRCILHSKDAKAAASWIQPQADGITIPEPPPAPQRAANFKEGGKCVQPQGSSCVATTQTYCLAVCLVLLKPPGAAITNLLDACISGKTFCFIHLVC